MPQPTATQNEKLDISQVPSSHRSDAARVQATFDALVKLRDAADGEAKGRFQELIDQFTKSLKTLSSEKQGTVEPKKGRGYLQQQIANAAKGPQQGEGDRTEAEAIRKVDAQISLLDPLSAINKARQEVEGSGGKFPTEDEVIREIAKRFGDLNYAGKVLSDPKGERIDTRYTAEQLRGLSDQERLQVIAELYRDECKAKFSSKLSEKDRESTKQFMNVYNNSGVTGAAEVTKPPLGELPKGSSLNSDRFSQAAKLPPAQRRAEFEKLAKVVENNLADFRTAIGEAKQSASSDTRSIGELLEQTRLLGKEQDLALRTSRLSEAAKTRDLDQALKLFEEGLAGHPFLDMPALYNSLRDALDKEKK